ncbi:branched-chain amino acid ABC transporter permease [Dactylosporangium sp. CA-092794]|uniref:branched-chain amino acid ABC transporter permease n=1 Tax=Dactylosporangium sp. CA-092794 TaxID=3239929 RepID=UPI003D9401BC
MKLRISHNNAGHGARRAAYVLIILLTVAALLANTLPLPSSYISEGNLVLIAAFGAYGLNLITGYAGQASIGNAGFMAIGGLGGWYVGQHTSSFLVSLLAGAASGLIAGAIVGAIALRWRGFYLVLATLAVQSIVVFVMQEIQLGGSKFVAGFTFDVASIGGWAVDDDQRWFTLLAVLLALVIFGVVGPIDGKFGRAWMAIRENEGAADVSGINVTWTKILVFSVGSAIISLGGALSASYAGSMSYESFTLDVSTSFIAMIIVGGLGSMTGPLLGAIVVTLIPYLISSGGNSDLGRTLNDLNGGTGLPFLEIIFYCVIVLLFLVFEPAGLSNLGPRLWRAVRRAAQRRNGSDVDGPAPAGALPQDREQVRS